MEGIVGKKVIIFYDDLGKVSRKDGELTAISDSDYTLDNYMIIPKARVIRVEVRNGQR
ncbi:MAG: hypothetical protein R6V14_05385 [Halanaerobiales bacterium]